MNDIKFMNLISYTIYLFYYKYQLCLNCFDDQLLFIDLP